MTFLGFQAEGKMKVELHVHKVGSLLIVHDSNEWVTFHIPYDSINYQTTTTPYVKKAYEAEDICESHVENVVEALMYWKSRNII